MHFIDCGRADSILIKQNSRYGWIDVSRQYSRTKDIVKSAGKGTEKSPDKNSKAIVYYLTHFWITHLDFISSTHAHSDIINGKPKLAYHFAYKNNKLLHN